MNMNVYTLAYQLKMVLNKKKKVIQKQKSMIPKTNCCINKFFSSILTSNSTR